MLSKFNSFSSLMKRILSAAILLPIFCILFYLGGNYVIAAITLLHILAFFEWTNMTKSEFSSFDAILLAISVFSAIIFADIFTIKSSIVILLYVLWIGEIILLTFVKKIPHRLSLLACSLLAFISVNMQMVNKIGGLYVFWFWGAIWAMDITAYFVGTKYGKSKILPKVSPNKSWEGFGAGVAAAAIWSAIWFIVLTKFSTIAYSFITMLLVVAITAAWSALAHAGDFAESYLKRLFDSKDSGDIIPGHGGVMDRFDSAALFFILVVVSCYLGFLTPVLGDIILH